MSDKTEHTPGPWRFNEATQIPDAGWRSLAAAIHYPKCWDTAAYPTLEDALSELAAAFQCTNEDTHVAPPAPEAGEPETETMYCWLVELAGPLVRQPAYHTGFTDLHSESRSTTNPHEAKKYATKEQAVAVAQKLGFNLVGTWGAVEHGFERPIATPPVQRDAEPVAPLLDDEGRAMVGASHHYTAENIRCLIDELKFLEDPMRGSTQVDFDRPTAKDWRSWCGVLWRVIAGLASDVPLAQRDAEIDIEAMLSACLPGGDYCDPQLVADNIRAWAAKEGQGK